MKTMEDFHDLYLKYDFLLLADVFEKFRNNSLKNYGLYPKHYLSTPALSSDFMLNITKGELELISDANLYLFFEKGIGGGVCCISKRYSQANNKYLKSCDPKQESKRITLLDVNYLYGYTMFKFLPTVEFKWIVPKDFYINKYNKNSSKGCVLEVYFEYPKELRELNN